MKRRIMISVSAALAIFMVMAPLKIMAFNQADFDRVKRGGVSCTGCDLSGACLVGLNFGLHSMAKANLKGAAMMNIIFQSGQLDSADLSGAALMNADLSNCSLNNTVFTGAILTGANLKGSLLGTAKLIDAVLTGATWTDGRKCGPNSIGICR